MKRGIDIILSILFLIVLLPLMGIICIINSFEVGFKYTFFIQKRLGKNGIPFRMIKFRTLRKNPADQKSIGHRDNEITKFGKFLRTYSLDELPQLFNVLWNDMSIIGPRPLPVEYLAYISENYPERNQLKPGLLCLAHIHGRNELNWDERFHWDMMYIQSNNLLVDLRILLMLPLVVVKGQGNIPSPNLLLNKW